MTLSDEMRHFLIDISEQIRMDGIAIKMAYPIVQKTDPNLAEMLEYIQTKGHEKWEELLKLLD